MSRNAASSVKKIFSSKRSAAEVIKPSLFFGVQRGAVVALSSPLPGAGVLALVVSNNVQNENSDELLLVPLQKRNSRLKAPFAVDLGKGQGFRDLHVARCDWVTRVSSKNISTVILAALPGEIMQRVGEALKVALNI